ncbi:MAG: HAD-IC family P-type ATPase, partial [Luteolibacter sp.]
NGLVGFVQENRAGKAIEALSSMIQTAAKVKRDGRVQSIPSHDLVPGDVVILRAGDRIPADLRLFEVENLRCDESALTGESLPVAKKTDPLDHDVALAERTNQAFAGTWVTVGNAQGVVWATGDRTETGRIAWLLTEAIEIATPLTRKIARFSRCLLWAILALAGLVFCVGVLRGEPLLDMLMACIALAVGAIPEGLPAAMTILLAAGVAAMAKRRALIRKMPAVETLGSTTVICSDKTGTLTENQMTVQVIYAGGRTYQVTGSGYQLDGQILSNGIEVEDRSAHPALHECLLAGMLCNEAELWMDHGRIHIRGEPTEAALLVAAAKGGLVRENATAESPVIDTIPFGSDHMFRATMHRDRANANERVIYKVGAVESLLKRCEFSLDASGNQVSLDRENVHDVMDELTAQGLRVLALAKVEAAPGQQRLEHHHVQKGLVFLGLQGMIDPPRSGVVDAIRHCRKAGISVKMITGDHAGTARAIAARIGLADQDGSIRVMNGNEIDPLDDANLSELANQTTVFARVTPIQKLRLVKAFQTRGHVVAMTGDGVNDAPALKQADIGIAMGIGGTDVAKSAADMILTDDNFSTIEAAVEEGRHVFDNLTKFLVWTLPTSIGEGGIITVAILAGTALPLLPVQLLWVNMTTALLLGLMLVFEPKAHGLMARPPRDPRQAWFTGRLVFRTLLVSFLMIGGGIALFQHASNSSAKSLESARTIVVNTVVMVEVCYLFACRSLREPLWKLGFFSNPGLLAGVAAMLLLQYMFTYLPLMNRCFHTVPLEMADWLGVIAVASLAFIAVELEKTIRDIKHAVRHR